MTKTTRKLKNKPTPMCPHAAKLYKTGWHRTPDGGWFKPGRVINNLAPGTTFTTRQALVASGLLHKMPG